MKKILDLCFGHWKLMYDLMKPVTISFGLWILESVLSFLSFELIVYLSLMLGALMFLILGVKGIDFIEMSKLYVIDFWRLHLLFLLLCAIINIKTE